MLQQTQVSTVIPYYIRFLERFPSLKALADSPEDDVLRHWAGLGYYARARNLKKAAAKVMAEFGGELPADLDALVSLPGIGRSTAGAIVSLGSGRRAPILDGNVKRVLSRYAALEGWPGEPRNEKELWRLSEALTPGERAADYNQAMMDLGAMVCTRNHPDCPHCPLARGCLAFRHGLTGDLPAPRPKREIPIRSCWMLILQDEEGRIYLEKRPPVGIWGGLWSFPQFEAREDLDVWRHAREMRGELEALPQRRHTFSHFHLDYIPLLGTTTGFMRVADPSHLWVKPEDSGPVPAPVRRLMLEIAGLV